MKSFAVGGFILLSMVVPTIAYSQIQLQNATATFSQTLGRNWYASDMIDGIIGDQNGWAIFEQGGATRAQVAIFEAASDLNAAALSIDMIQAHTASLEHLVGRFRWSATTDDRSTFADGLQSDGAVAANWTVLTPLSVSQPGSMSSTILGDGSVLMSGISNTATYTVTLNLGLSNVTGLRLEVMEDASLPTDGPGLKPTNGNFVLTEIKASAVPEPATWIVCVAGLAALRLRKRRS